MQNDIYSEIEKCLKILIELSGFIKEYKAAEKKVLLLKDDLKGFYIEKDDDATNRINQQIKDQEDIMNKKVTAIKPKC